MNADGFLSELLTLIDTREPRMESWTDLCILYRNGKEVVGEDVCREHVLPSVQNALDAKWPDEERSFYHDEDAEETPWELGKALAFGWDYHEATLANYNAFAALWREGPFEDYTTLVLNALGSKALDVVMGGLCEGMPRIKTVSLTIDNSMDDERKTTAEMFEALGEHLAGWSETLETFSIMLPGSKPRQATMPVLWEALSKLLPKLSRLRRTCLTLRKYSAHPHDPDGFARLLENLGTTTSLGVIFPDDVLRARLLEILQNSPETLHGLSTLLVNDLEDEYLAFWRATRWLDEPRLYRGRPMQMEWDAWKDDYWRVENALAGSVDANDDQNDSPLFDSNLRRLELSGHRGLTLDMMRALLGSEERPRVHAQITELFVEYPLPECFALFLKRGPVSFPNVRDIEFKQLKKIEGTFVAEHLDDFERSAWPNLERLKIGANDQPVGFLLSMFDYPALHTLDIFWARMDAIEALCEHHGSWSELKDLEISTYQKRTDQVFIALRGAGLFSKLERMQLKVEGVKSDRDAACSMVELVTDETIPLPWRQHLFEAIREPDNKKVLYTILKQIGAPARSNSSRGDLDRMWAEYIPEGLKTPDADALEHVSDLTQFDDF